MKPETHYFSHDYNARMDDKIQDLLCDHGMQGYGIYWAIVEDLYNNANALRTQYKRIAHMLHTNDEVVQSVVENYGLFKVDGDFFSSDSVARRLEHRNEKSVKASKSASFRWGKSPDDANAMQTHSDRNAIKESKVKESKVNNITIKNSDSGEPHAQPKFSNPIVGEEKKIERFVAPEIHQVQEYFFQKEFSAQEADNFFNHYTANGWMTGRVKMKNWQAAANKWISNSKNWNNQNGNRTTNQGQSGKSTIDKWREFANGPIPVVNLGSGGN